MNQLWRVPAKRKQLMPLISIIRNFFVFLVFALALTGCCNGGACNFSPPNQMATCNSSFDINSVDSSLRNQFSPTPCSPTTARLFTDSGPNDVFEFELQADFDVINDPTISVANKDQAKSPGTLRYVDPTTNQTIEIPIMLEARGHSRFTYCAFRPLKIVFGSHQVGNIFEGASKKVKVVTHCGNHPTNSWILGGTPEEQRRRLLAEYYFYQVLETQGSMSLATRIARITYKDDDGTEIITEYAFLREREDDTCKRCGFVDEADDLEVPLLTPNQDSVFQATFYNKFAYNNDFVVTSGHNTRICKGSSLNGFYIPYDWDLTGVIRPEYHKNKNVDYRDNVDTFWAWLNSGTSPMRTKVQAWNFVQHETEMRQVLQDTLLDQEGQDLMNNWLNLYTCALKCYLGMDCAACQVTNGCQRSGDDILFATDFEADTVGSPPGSGLNLSGNAGAIEVVASSALSSKAMKIVRTMSPTEVEAHVADSQGMPFRAGKVHINFRAHGEVIPNHLIAGTVVSVRSSSGEAILILKLFDGAYHLLEGGSYVRLAGTYNPGEAHSLHIEVDLSLKVYKVCIEGNMVAAHKPFHSSAAMDLQGLKFIAPATVTEAFQADYVVDEIKLSKN